MRALTNLTHIQGQNRVVISVVITKTVVRAWSFILLDQYIFLKTDVIFNILFD